MIYIISLEYKYLNPDNKDRTEYIKSIFNNDYTELTLEDGRTVGYKTFENVLHLWEGKYDSRTAQSFYDWAVIARHFEAMRLLGELSDSIKPLPSMDGQMTFILDGRAEEKKTSAFTFSQEIIDAILANGSGFSEGKMRIYEQFEKSLSAKENADFLKNEYGWGGSYPVIIGAGIDESHDGKGITITKGIGKENPHITLSWSQVEKRIGELIRMDRYLNPKEKERYPQWLESQEERRAKIEETKRNREILSNAPPEQEVEPAEKEPEEAEQLQDVQYEYHLGDKVYIGASEYEILSVDDERVMLYDYDMPLFNKEFSRTEFDRKVRENPMNEHLIVKEEPAEERNETEEVQTNMGSMPIEDYREIVASQSGFDSYDEMYHQGYRIGNGYDKEPEPVVPAWEQKKKVKGFDLHPDVPMADRHTFNLRENEVETVGKKERFRRNIMAIQLLKKCQEENRFATPEEQIVLSKYVGWGGLSEAFDENNSAWATEYLELSSVLTPEEYASARESTLTAFYTPPEVITAIYDTFSDKYGLINSRANTSAFSQDSSFSLLSALEIIGEDGELERKADMFSKRTIKPHTPVTSVDTASEALAVSLGEKATIDMDYMMELSGKSENEIFEDLKGVIFLNPLYEYGNSYEPKYLMTDEYLSGNVREKLRIAKNSAELYPEDYKVNVEALQKVQPKDLTASEISVRLGATWLPPDDVQEFIFHLLETPRYAQWNIKVHFSPFTSEWNIEGKSYDKGNVRAYNTYGTSRINAYKIIEETLNLKDVRIFDYIEDDEGRKKAVLNKKETAIAQSKQEMIKQEFQDWIWSDPERRERLCKSYNEKFNSVRPREYDGSHIIFNGMNPEIELREHQKNAVAHILYGGNTLLAHAVGAGKTFEMVAAAQESKRLGLCNKSLFVVPNHLTEQWAAEYLQLYPAANILVATKKDFETNDFLCMRMGIYNKKTHERNEER